MILKPNEIKPKVDGFLDLVRQRNGHEPEFLQAVEEVAETVIPYIIQNDIYHGKKYFTPHGRARARHHV
jgi:hypothetical protein